MALVMRLRKLGSRHQPHFRIAVAESASGRDSRFVEELGWYDPKLKGDNSKLNEERARYWLAKGAKPTDTVRSILKKHNLFGTAPPTEAAAEPLAEPAEPVAEPEAAAEPGAPAEPEAAAGPEGPAEQPEPPPEATQ